MRHKLLLLLIFATFYGTMQAQIKDGSLVTTSSGSSYGFQNVKIWDVSNAAGAPAGDNWGLLNPTYPNWTPNRLGQIFGVTINTTGTDHLIYVSTTQIYPAASPGYTSGYQTYPTATNGGTPLIWSLDPAVAGGGVTPLVTSYVVDACLSNNTTPGIFNRGTDIGNLCYDADHNQIFATNMEDGRIYRIDASTGNVLSRYDPFNPYVYAANNNQPTFLHPGEKLWGIAYYNDTVYFSQWNADFGHRVTGGSPHNMIYSVPINALSGDFVATPGCSQYEWLDQRPHLVITVPYDDATLLSNSAYSNPVSDIKISLDGSTMLLAERTMSGDFPGAVSYYSVGNLWDHRARALNYGTAASGWAAGPIYFVGNLNAGVVAPDADYINQNCSGGVDFGYKFVDSTHTRDQCDSVVWVAADAIKFGAGSYEAGSHLTEFVYGFAGVPIVGNNAFAWPTPDPYNVSKSIDQDIFTASGGPEGSTTFKDQVGDLVTFRSTACNTCLSYKGQAAFRDSSNGMQYTFYDSSAIAPTFVNWYIDGDTTPLRTIGLDPLSYTFTTVGSHTVCMEVAYIIAGANGTNICCYDKVCDTVLIGGCQYWKATDTILVTVDPTNFYNVTFTYVGNMDPVPTILWGFSDGFDTTTSGTAVTHTFPKPGKQEFCAEIIWSVGPLPGASDSFGVCCCVDTICQSIDISPCSWGTFALQIVDSTAGIYTFQLVPTGMSVGLAVNNWYVDGNPETGSGSILIDTPLVSGSSTICVDYTNFVFYNNKQIACPGQLCETFNLTAGVNATSTVGVHPNPTDGIVLVTLNNNGNETSAKIEFLNVTGQVVLTKSVDYVRRGATSVYMNIKELPQGIYQVRTMMGNTLQVTKLVKE